MEPIPSSDFFVGNRQRLRQLFTGTAPIVISANGLLQRGGDNTYAFSQDANFWYLTGIEDPDIILVMDKSSEFLIIPGRSDNRETFDGSIETSDISDKSGIKEIYEEKEGWEKLGSRIKKVKHVATIASAPSYIEAYGFYTNPARETLARRIKSLNSDIELLDLSQHLIKMRMIKQPVEIKLIQSAIDITGKGLAQAIRPAMLKKYKHEYEIEAEITKGIRSLGASGHAFEPIVASGERACTLHNIANSGVLSEDGLVLVDIGAEVNHYAADISRTFSINPEPSKRQRSVFLAVQEVQQYAISLLKPGTLLRDYEQSIETFMGEKLRELNLIKTITRDSVRKYFPHATSHFLGLNVHDIGNHDAPLVPGCVLTIEPGIYIKEESIGIRIEDDGLITPKGIRILSDKLPQAIA